MWAFSRSRVGSVAVTLLTATLLVGCRPDIEPEGSFALNELFGRLVIDDDQLVIPSSEWRADLCEDEPWGFRNRASVWFWFDTDLAPDDDLLLRLRARPADADKTIRATWGDASEDSENHEVAPSGWLQIPVPQRQLGPGVHRLKLEQPYLPHGEEQVPACFEQLRWRRGDRDAGIAGGNRERLAYLESFLSRGVVGLDEQKRGGSLFFGPGRLEQPIAQQSVATLRFELENASRAEARFVATAGEESAEVTVPPRKRRALVLTVPAGADLLALEVSGADNGLFLWGAPVVEASTPPQRPPVIVVTLDTTRPDVLSPYGHPDAAPTPALDSLAEHATLFDEALATAPWTLPSHASLFTGLYPSRHGAGVWHDHLGSQHPTLAEHFRDAGYATAGFVGGHMAGSSYGLGQGFGLYVDPRTGQERGDYLMGETLQWIEEHQNVPFLLFLNLFDPHAPYDAPEPWRADFRVGELEARLDSLDFRSMAAGDNEAWARIIDGRAEHGEPELEWLEAAYRAEVAFTDAQMGRLFDRLRDLGLYDPAWIVVTADHGEFLGERGWFSHGGRLDPELIDIPLIVKRPHQSEAARTGEPVSLIDLYPTLLSVLEVEPGSELDGVSLIPLMDDPGTLDSREGARELLFEEHQSLVHLLFPYMTPALHQWGRREQDLHRAVWEGGSECARRQGQTWHFLECPGNSERIRSEILRALGQSAPDELPAAGTALDPEELEKLRALGYVPPDQ